MMKEVKISVRNLVELILRSGDIDNRFVGGSRALEGTIAHQKVQGSYKENYKAEVSLKHSYVYNDINFLVEGRADGILTEGENIIIDEIKSTTKDLTFLEEDYNHVHWAQAKCYGHFYCNDNDIDKIIIQLTYYNIENEEIKIFRKNFSREELKIFFEDIIEKYYKYADFSIKWQQKRNISISEMNFPFDKYRKGQRELAVRVYKSIIDSKKCFAQAPTGTGKTISTLFPAIKAMGEGHTCQIFYLTAKAIAREVAEKSIKLLRNQGLLFKSVTLTAKDKVCFKDKAKCNPDYCEYAKGYYDKINDVLFDLLSNEDEFTREVIEKYSIKNKICPFELSLDLTIYADAIICDYNYLFDPRVSLKRFFENNGEYTFLIDEAHNLVDRGRDMYSMTLFKKNILELKKQFKNKDKKVYRLLDKLNSFMINIRKDCEEKGYYITKEEPKELYSLLRVFLEVAEEHIKENPLDENEELMQLYFDAHSFLKIGELYDERFITFCEKDSDDVFIKLFCLDPSHLLKEMMKKGKSSVVFSATLLPMDYFKELLGGNEEDYYAKLSSPFDKNNRNIFIASNISTKYVNRQKSVGKIVDYIKCFVDNKLGNYIIFFPSYKYMEEVYDEYIKVNPLDKTVVQSNTMNEEEKEEFLNMFKEAPKHTHIAFCVLGGHFSEGIDLIEDRLIGVGVVGVGLPQVGIERDIIKEYFDEKEGLGFQYAYVYPGIIKVFQAVGRCIRTENDRGAILLMDERFVTKNYENLYPSDWFPNRKVRSLGELNEALKVFWSTTS
ncbi:MAG: ATP-dependent DNA helicase [Clostridiaceae bacterium]